MAGRGDSGARAIALLRLSRASHMTRHGVRIGLDFWMGTGFGYSAKGWVGELNNL